MGFIECHMEHGVVRISFMLSCYDVQQDQTTESPFAQTRERITLFVPSMPRGGVMAGETSPL